MIINGKEIGFYYSVWAHCELSDYIVSHPDVSATRGIMQKALIMNKAYVKAFGGETLMVADFENLPASVFIEIQKAISEQEAKDSKITVETKPGKKTEKAE